MKLRQLTCNGIEIAFRDQGHGPPLLMLHGLGANHSCWDHQIAHFSRTWRVVAPDLRGFGQSAKPLAADAYSVAGFAADMVSLLDQLDCQTATVVGTSLGGYVAQQLAVDHPERVERLALCHTACRRQVPPEILAKRLQMLAAGDMDAYAAMVADQALGPGTQAVLRQTVQTMIAANHRQAYRLVLEGIDFDLTAQLGGVRCPTLVLAGGKDQVVPLDRSLQIWNTLPDSQLAVIAEGGHLSYLEYPELFNDLLAAGLAWQPRRSADPAPAGYDGVARVKVR